MGETTQEEREYWRDIHSHAQHALAADISVEEVRRLLNDADRLAQIERQLDHAHDSLHELLANHINIMDPAAAVAKRGLWGGMQHEQEKE